MANIFILGLPVVVREEVLVGDSINVDMSQGFVGRLNEVGFMSFGVNREGTEVLQFFLFLTSLVP